MGEVRHLSIDSLSALQDGELEGSEAASARAHLAACPACQADAGSLARLEEALRLPPALSCDAALPFLSAACDGEADAFDAGIASRHLTACSGCRLAGSAWTGLQAALAGTPALPSVRVDHAMAALTRPERGPRGPRPAVAGPLGGVAWRGAGVAWRGAVVAVLAFAIAFGSTLAPQRDDDAAPVTTGPRDPALVAAVQQVVLHPASNTLYVAQPDEGAVNALDATTYEVRARIPVGGRPTALALNDPANRLIVLDGAAKSLTEIDLASNAVVETTKLQLSGTPTSVQVDNGKIAVFTAVAPPAPIASAASAAATVPTGQVAVFDPGTKKLETVRNVDVAPRLVVPDPATGRTLLVSPEATTVADASYRTIETIGGGVGAAFGRGGRIAVLSSGADAARVTFYGEAAPAAVQLEGRPTAVIALPDGRFAVLLDIAGRGRIVVLDGSGQAAGQADLAVAGRGLAYDAAAKKFTVVGAGEIASASLPTLVAQAPRSADASAMPGASATASPTVTPTASPAASPAASPSPSPSPPTTSPLPSGAPSASPQAPSVAGVPAGAVRVANDLYRVPLGDSRLPVLVASTDSRVWFMDQRNQLGALDTSSGAFFTVAQLPRDAILRGLAVGRTHVYAVDIARGRLFELAIKGERLTSHPLPVTDVSALTVAPDGTVWMALPSSPQLLAFHPGSGRIEVLDVGIRGSIALAADAGGRVWFSNGAAGIGWYDARTGRVAHLGWPGAGTPTVLLADPFGQIWAGTANGDLYFLREAAANLIAQALRPVTALGLDPKGQVWYLAPAVQGSGFAYGPVNGSQGARSVPGPVTSLAVNAAGRVWLADLSGGFYLGTETGR